MNSISLIGLSLAMFVFAASPGPGVLATLARSLSSGFRSTLAFIAGIVAGDMLYLMFAIFGLSAAAKAMGEMFVLLKILGGLYLVWLGTKLWLTRSQEAEDNQGMKVRSGYGHFGGGFLLTLSNPKVILFYCGFLPTFLDLSSLGLIEIGVVGMVIASVLFSVLVSYALLADSIRPVLSGRVPGRYLNRVAGGLMVATGVTVGLRS